MSVDGLRLDDAPGEAGRFADAVALDGLLGRLELSPLLRAALAICDALSALHDTGSLHNDLKPSNIHVSLAASRAWLSGLRAASSIETRAPRKANISSNLAYVAPERTGRGAIHVDRRADLYSFGMVLYQLATGKLPFAVSEPLEWVHAHVAVRPIPPSEHVALPDMVQRILLKLLEKEPDDRYQTASGLAHDLRECLTRFEASGSIAHFPLGRHDTLGNLARCQSFQGRVREVDALLAVFESVERTGASALALVTGSSGIGKSSLIGELVGRRLPHGTLVARGKFDDLESDAPYATLMQLFRELCRWVLAEPVAALSDWKGAFLRALGDNTSVVAALIPELEPIIGRTPPAAWAPADESRNRLYASFRQFLRVFAARKPPLVLFLDDLHWLDAASLGLIEHLLLDPELYGVLFIGAYRTEEVADEHPLRASLARLQAAGRSLHTVPLAPLAPPEVARLVADALFSSPETITELSRVIEEKTGGNPFFVRQFLRALAEERLLRFDQQSLAWAWDLPGILAKGPTDNLTELLLERLARLPPSTRHALEVLACLGVRSTPELLADLIGVAPDVLGERLRPALLAEVVVETNAGYAFRHDRLLTAAYSLIAEVERPARHLAIGRALIKRGEGLVGDGLAEIVRHLNRGAALLCDVPERIELAERTLEFAQRARSSAASVNALAYLEQAFELLPEDHWRSLPKLSFELALARAEAAFLSGEPARAEAALALLAERDLDDESLGAVAMVQLPLYLTSNRAEQAVNVGLGYLRRLGVPWHSIDDEEVQRQYEALLAALGDRPIASLIDAPAMTSRSVQVTMEVCASLASPAYFYSQRLFALLTMHMIRLSIEHGTCESTGFAYATACIVLGPFFGDHGRGVAFAQVGGMLAEARSNRFAARTLLTVGALVVPRTVDAHAGYDWLVRACDAADQYGDLLYGVYIRSYRVISLLGSGAPLVEAERQAEIGIAHAERQQFALIAERCRILRGFIRSLRVPGREPGSLGDVDFDEAAYEQRLGETPDLYYYSVRRAQASYYAGDFARAREAARRARGLIWTSPFFPEELDLRVFGALAEAACADPSAPGEALALIITDERELADWIERCPQTFASKAALVRGERARLEGRDADAEQSFEAAAQLARQYGLVHEEALSHELAARLYAARGIKSVARAKLAAARACYARWGALAKVSSLDAQLGADDAVAPPLADLLEQLDVKVLVSALQAVSSSLDLEALIDSLLTSALRHAAAERGFLVLLADEPRIRAGAVSRDGVIQVTRGDAPVSPDQLPVSVLRYVLRSASRVALRDGALPEAFRGDPYFAKHVVRSLLCMPIIARGKAVGALYVENTLTRQEFGARGLAVLELIASQAAISLENAQLFAGLLQAQQRMTRAEQVSRTGSFSLRAATQELEWSPVLASIYRLDGPPSLARLRERTHPEDRALFDSLVEDSAPYDGQTVELRLMMPDGALKHLEMVVSRVANDFVGTVRDVTETKHAEEALQLTQAALTDMTRVASLGELAAAIAHEVNQPLSAIGLNASTCLRWLEGEALDLGEAREAALRIRRDAGRASDVVQRLRALFSKSEGVKVSVDLNDAISEVVALVRRRIRAAGAALTLELGTDLPPALGDRVQLQQVVMNLLTNALEAMREEDTESRTLTIRSRVASPGRLCCEVEDSGRGVREADRARIFEPFYTTKLDGMGIGLSICNNILFSHDGELGVRPNAGRAGATFYFVLPAASLAEHTKV